MYINGIIFNYYRNYFIIVLHISGIEDKNELEISIMQFQIEIEIKMKYQLEEEGSPVFTHIPLYSTKTCIELLQRYLNSNHFQIGL